MENSEEFYTRPVVVCFLALFCCFLWGSAFPVTKICYRLFAIENASPGTFMLFAGCRFFIAGALVLIFGSHKEAHLLRLSRRNFPEVLLVTIFQTVLQYALFNVGLAHASGTTSSILVGTNVFFVVLLSSLVFRLERLTTRKLLGCSLGFLGVVLVNLKAGAVGGFRWNGEGAVLLSAVSSALSTCFLRIYAQQEDPLLLSAHQFLMGGTILILVGLALGGRIPQVSLSAVVLLLYLSVLSAVASTLWAVLLRYHPASRLSMYGFMNPVFGVLLSGLVLGEKGALGWRGLLALALVAAGIFVVNGRKAKEKRA